MHILFVCTGNVCRSPMAQYHMEQRLTHGGFHVSSAGIRGLVAHAMDPLAVRSLREHGVDQSRVAAFRSRRISKEMIDGADLLLCFDRVQRKEIVTIDATAVRHTFVVTDFANMCEYCLASGLMHGDSPEERLDSVIAVSSMIRPMLPDYEEIEDPHGRSFETFSMVFDEIDAVCGRILKALGVEALGVQDNGGSQ